MLSKLPVLFKTVRKPEMRRVHIKTFKSIQIYGAKNINLKYDLKETL